MKGFMNSEMLIRFTCPHCGHIEYHKPPISSKLCPKCDPDHKGWKGSVKLDIRLPKDLENRLWEGVEDTREK